MISWWSYIDKFEPSALQALTPQANRLLIPPKPTWAKGKNGWKVSSGMNATHQKTDTDWARNRCKLILHSLVPDHTNITHCLYKCKFYYYIYMYCTLGTALKQFYTVYQYSSMRFYTVLISKANQNVGNTQSPVSSIIISQITGPASC
jgi:hypothetical protein